MVCSNDNVRMSICSSQKRKFASKTQQHMRKANQRDADAQVAHDDHDDDDDGDDDERQQPRPL